MKLLLRCQQNNREKKISSSFVNQQVFDTYQHLLKFTSTKMSYSMTQNKEHHTLSLYGSGIR